MHIIGAPYTYNGLWRDKVNEPIRRPILNSVIPIRLIRNKPSRNASSRESSNPVSEGSNSDSGIGMEMIEEEEVTGDASGIKIVIIPATPMMAKLGDEKKKTGECSFSGIPKARRRNSMGKPRIPRDMVISTEKESFWSDVKL
jgi:hypothetical protein